MLNQNSGILKNMPVTPHPAGDIEPFLTGDKCVVFVERRLENGNSQWLLVQLKDGGWFHAPKDAENAMRSATDDPTTIRSLVLRTVVEKTMLGPAALPQPKK